MFHIKKIVILVTLCTILMPLYSVDIVGQQSRFGTIVEEQNNSDNNQQTQTTSIDLERETPSNKKFDLFCFVAIIAYAAALPITYYLYDNR